MLQGFLSFLHHEIVFLNWLIVDQVLLRPAIHLASYMQVFWYLTGYSPQVPDIFLCPPSTHLSAR